MKALLFALLLALPARVAPPARAADRVAPVHAVPAHAAPARVVSLNLCADQLLVLLAPERVAALSTLSRDPALSHVAPRAAALPQLREVAAALGVPDRGETLIRDMDARLAALPHGRVPPASPTAGGRTATVHDPPAPAPNRQDGPGPAPRADGSGGSAVPAPPPRALLWGARGWTSGPGTLGDAVLRAAGFENAGTGGVVGLEALLSRPPDVLATAQAPAFPSLATDLLHHPALAALPRRTVPPATLICAGPFSVLAAEMLAR